MSKREARIARAEEKELREREKSARLRERPVESRQVRLGADPNSIYQMHVTWSCDDPDCNGSWSWGPRQWTESEWTQSIEPKLVDFSRLTWAEVDRLSSGSGHKMHHSMSVNEICEEAQDRLVEIDKVSETIFRFRLGGKPRLWGFRIVSHFEVLWFDPEHSIYPIDPS